MKRILINFIIVLLLFLQTGIVLATEEGVSGGESSAVISAQVDNSGDKSAIVEKAENTEQPNTEEEGQAKDAGATDSAKTENTDKADVSTSATGADPKPEVAQATEPEEDSWKNISGFDDNAVYDLFTGEFRFKTSFDAPKGRSGLTPALQLVYSSLNKNNLSPFGMGMDLSIGSIYRLTNQGGDQLYTEGNNYEFAVKIFGQFEEVILVDAVKGMYMDKYGRSYTKYYFDRTNNSWKAEDTGGNTYYFGQSLSSRQYDPENPNNVFLWNIDKIVNSRGDKMEFEYNYDAVHNQIYPSKIKYGFYPQNGDFNNLVNLYEVGFEYFLTFSFYKT